MSLNNHRRLERNMIKINTQRWDIWKVVIGHITATVALLFLGIICDLAVPMYREIACGKAQSLVTEKQ